MNNYSITCSMGIDTRHYTVAAIDTIDAYEKAGRKIIDAYSDVLSDETIEALEDFRPKTKAEVMSLLEDDGILLQQIIEIE